MLEVTIVDEGDWHEIYVNHPSNDKRIYYNVDLTEDGANRLKEAFEEVYRLGQTDQYNEAWAYDRFMENIPSENSI